MFTVKKACGMRLQLSSLLRLHITLSTFRHVLTL